MHLLLKPQTPNDVHDYALLLRFELCLWLSEGLNVPLQLFELMSHRVKDLHFVLGVDLHCARKNTCGTGVRHCCASPRHA